MATLGTHMMRYRDVTVLFGSEKSVLEIAALERGCSWVALVECPPICRFFLRVYVNRRYFHVIRTPSANEVSASVCSDDAFW